MRRLLPARRRAVPDQRVAVRREPPVHGGLRREEELVRRRPLLRREVERRGAMLDRDDHAAAGQDVGRVAWIARRGIDAVVVLEIDLGRLAQARAVAEDAVTHRRASGRRR